MIVVLGNAIMYYICYEVADNMYFQNVDEREICYVVLYTFACVLQVCLDTILTFFVAYQHLVGMGMPTYGGKALAEVGWYDSFESYAMQKELGQNLYDYSFPSTFLIPFLLEPLVAIYLPWKVMQLWIDTSPMIAQVDAESFMMPIPMELSRYGDILLNVILAVMIFFFPGGFTHYMFLALALCHIYIYAYDQVRVTKCVRSCCFASQKVDWWACWMLSVPCSLMLSATLFKANCVEGVPWCMKDKGLVMLVLGAIVGHILFHTAILLWVVPLFFRDQDHNRDIDYEHCARQKAMSWFSANPVHCLRSKYVYEEDPPCDFCTPGKEHLMRPNPKLHLFFRDEYDSDEDEDELAVTKVLSETWRVITRTPKNTDQDVKLFTR